MTQQPLALEWVKDYSDQSFLRGEHNAEAYQWIHIWPEQFTHIQFSSICGPKSSGKSHLLSIWQKKHNAVLIDNYEESPYDLVKKGKYFILPHIDLVKEHEWLFHLYNVLNTSQCFLLVSAYKAPELWQADTKDLASRFKMFYPVEIKRPEKLDPILKKMLKDKGLMLSDFQIQYVVKRIERSFDSLHRFASAIDQLEQDKGCVKFQDVCDLCV